MSAPTTSTRARYDRTPSKPVSTSDPLTHNGEPTDDLERPRRRDHRPVRHGAVRPEPDQLQGLHRQGPRPWISLRITGSTFRPRTIGRAGQLPVLSARPRIRGRTKLKAKLCVQGPDLVDLEPGSEAAMVGRSKTAGPARSNSTKAVRPRGFARLGAFRALIACAPFLLPLPTPAWAGPAEDAAAAYQRRDYATAARLYQPLADQATPKPRTSSATSTSQRPGRAAGLCPGAGAASPRRRAGPSVSPGQARPHVPERAGDGEELHRSGGLVPAAPPRWDLSGHSTSLGDMYLKGLGVEQDLLGAARWYSRAAEQGTPRPSSPWPPSTPSARACG